MRKYLRPLLVALSCISIIGVLLIVHSITIDDTNNNTSNLKAPVLSFSNSKDGVVISWDKIDSAVKYRIARKEKKGTWEVLDFTEAITYEDKSVEAGKVYFYTVYPCNDSGKGPVSNTVKVLRLTQPVITKIEVVDDAIAIRWNEVPGAGYYYLYRKTEDGKYTKISDRIHDLSFVDNSCEKGNIYYYRVIAANSANAFKSVYSKSVNVEY